MWGEAYYKTAQIVFLDGILNPYSKLPPPKTGQKRYSKSDWVTVLKSIFDPFFFQLDFPVYLSLGGVSSN